MQADCANKQTAKVRQKNTVGGRRGEIPEASRLRLEREKKWQRKTGCTTRVTKQSMCRKVHKEINVSNLPLALSLWVLGFSPKLAHFQAQKWFPFINHLCHSY